MGKLEDLQQRRSVIEQGGGAEKIKKQHGDGKKTARERLAMLFDEGSFIETDAFVTHRCKEFDMADFKEPCEGVVTGYGTADGRLVYAYSQDYTVMGGSLSEMHAAKICKIMDLAMKNGAPVVGIIDSAGARLQEGVDVLKGLGDILYRSAAASGVIPQISVVVGPCAGSAAQVAAMSDFVIMADGTSSMFISGSSVIKATGRDLPTDLGSAAANAENGNAAVVCKTEAECFAQLKELLSMLPSNNLEIAPEYDCNDDLNRLSEKLNSIAEDAARIYDVKEVIAEIADNGEFTELQQDFAKNMVTGFIRLNGSTVGVAANQPTVDGGAIDGEAAEKAARFVSFCDSFNIPVVTLTDTTGFVADAAQEKAGLVRRSAKLTYAFAGATVPKVNVIVGKAYGGAYAAMNSKHLGADMVFAWPTAEVSVMAADGAANIFFRDEIADAKDPVAVRQEKIDEYVAKYTNPYAAAARGYIDDIIEPASTRQYLIGALEMLMSKRESRPSKKHGNMPL